MRYIIPFFAISIAIGSSVAMAKKPKPAPTPSANLIQKIEKHGGFYMEDSQSQVICVEVPGPSSTVAPASGYCVIQEEESDPPNYWQYLVQDCSQPGCPTSLVQCNQVQTIDGPCARCGGSCAGRALTGCSPVPSPSPSTTVMPTPTSTTFPFPSPSSF